MTLWRRFRAMSIKQLLFLGVLFLKNPMLFLPTLKATKETLKTCNAHFGKMHQGNGIENAFRHALWNVKICQNVRKMTKTVEKSVNWCQKVTNLYEKVTKNNSLDRAMDLHNNLIGRMLYFEDNMANFEEILLKMMKKGQKIAKIDEIKLCPNQLVYISEA